MPEEEFDYKKYSSGGCIVPSLPQDCRCSGCGYDGYRDQISGFFEGDFDFVLLPI